MNMVSFFRRLNSFNNCPPGLSHSDFKRGFLSSQSLLSVGGLVQPKLLPHYQDGTPKDGLLLPRPRWEVPRGVFSAAGTFVQTAHCSHTPFSFFPGNRAPVSWRVTVLISQSPLQQNKFWLVRYKHKFAEVSWKERERETAEEKPLFPSIFLRIFQHVVWT